MLKIRLIYVNKIQFWEIESFCLLFNSYLVFSSENVIINLHLVICSDHFASSGENLSLIVTSDELFCPRKANFCVGCPVRHSPTLLCIIVVGESICSNLFSIELFCVQFPNRTIFLSTPTLSNLHRKYSFECDTLK